MFAAQAWSPAICHGSGQNTGLPALASAIAWSIDNCCSRAKSAVATHTLTVAGTPAAPGPTTPAATAARRKDGVISMRQMENLLVVFQFENRVVNDAFQALPIGCYRAAENLHAPGGC